MTLLPPASVRNYISAKICPRPALPILSSILMNECSPVVSSDSSSYCSNVGSTAITPVRHKTCINRFTVSTCSG